MNEMTNYLLLGFWFGMGVCAGIMVLAASAYLGAEWIIGQVKKYFIKD